MSSLTASTAEWLTSVSTQLQERLALVDVPMLSPAESKALLAGFVDVARLADAGAVLVANAVAEAHPVGVGAATTEEDALEELPAQAERILSHKEDIQRFAAGNFNKTKAFFMGRLFLLFSLNRGYKLCLSKYIVYLYINFVKRLTPFLIKL